MAGSRRNYKAMLGPKLLRSIHELREGRGDAYQRCIAKHGDPMVDLAIAEGEARDRGLNIGPTSAPAPAPPRESYAELIERVAATTGLNARRASVIAASLPDGTQPTTEQIITRAKALGYEPT